MKHKATHHLCQTERLRRSVSRCVIEEPSVPPYQNVNFTAELAPQLICLFHKGVFPSQKFSVTPFVERGGDRGFSMLKSDLCCYSPGLMAYSVLIVCLDLRS